MTKIYLKKIFNVFAFLIIVFFILELTGLRDHFNVQFLHQLITENILIGLFIFIIAFTLGNLIQIPGWIFLAVAVITFGQFYGGIVTYIAAIISCSITYIVIDFIGKNALRELKSPIAKKLFVKLDTAPILSIIVLRIIFQTAPALNYTLALSGVKFQHYLSGTILGLPLPIFLYCLFFDYLSKNIFHLSTI